jgi:putative lipoic acid-binding regulatory protein
VSDPADSPFAFPCDFAVKAMGKAGEGFDRLVVEIARRHAPDLDEGQVRTRESRGGKWVSVTVTLRATSKEQLDALYRELSAEERVVWAL